MQPVRRSAVLASVLVIGGMAALGSSTAKAQGFGGFPGGYGPVGYGAPAIAGGYLSGYGGAIVAYPAPVIVRPGYGGYGGYGYYNRGYAGYGYPRHYHHGHHRRY